MRGASIVLFFALSLPVDAQEGHLGSGHDKWHQSFYNTLQRPDGKGSCCNLTDCRPTSGRSVDGHCEVKVNGAWISVPQTSDRELLKRDDDCTSHSVGLFHPALH